MEREAVCPCRYIDPHSHQLFLFRVSYFERKINLEVFHALTDGLGGMNFLKALVCEYLRLKRESREQRPGQNKAEASHMYRIWGRRAARPGKRRSGRRTTRFWRTRRLTTWRTAIRNTTGK